MKKAGHPLSLHSTSIVGSPFAGILLAAAITAISLTPVLTPSAGAQGDTTPAATEAAAIPAPTSWLTYKGDLQRTGATPVRLGKSPNLTWRHSTASAGKTYDATPLVVGPPGQRRIYFAADRVVFCVDAETGAELWHSETLSRPVASPIILLPGDAGDLILAVTSSGELDALRTSDGARAWQVGETAPIQNVAPIVVKTAKGDRIIIALATGKLIAFTPGGQLDPSWEIRLGSFASSPTASPALSEDGKFLYIPTQDKKLFIVDLMAGKIAFPIGMRMGTYNSPIIFEGNIILSADTTLSSLKQRTGQTNWDFDVKSALSAAAVTRTARGSVIFAGARSGKFYAVNAATGAKLWETDLADSVTGAPTVTLDMVLVGTRNGVLFALSPDDGRILWRYRLGTERVLPETSRFGNNRNNTGGGTAGGGGAGGRGGTGTTAPRVDPNAPVWDTTETQTFGVTSPPAVIDGMVYLLADNAALYAFSTQPFDAAPPQVFNAQLSVPSSATRPVLQRLDPEKSVLIPGRAPIQLTAEISDTGSGVDPTSIVVKLNNQELPKTAVGTFADATGKLIVTLAEQKDRIAVNLADGLYTVAIAARDYDGNEMNYSINFLVDNTVAPPAPPETDTRNNNFGNNRRGGGGF